MERVTIKSLSKVLNVTPKTISRALNDEYGVSDDLRGKIKKLANEYNYVPNMFGRGLRGEKTNTVGVIVSDNSNPNYSLAIKGIETKAEECGQNIILCNSNENFMLEEKQIQLLIQRYVDGFILSPVSNTSGMTRTGLEKIKKLNIPYVLLNRYIDGEIDNCVKSDNALGAYLATEYLIKKGHKNIIHLTTKNEVSSSIERLAGFKKAITEAGLEFQDKNVYKCAFINQESSYNQMLEILKYRRDFSAIFAFNDLIAFGVIKAAHDCRLRIPSDIAVIGYDNILYSDTCLVPLTTVHQDSYGIGVTTMQILLDKINNVNVERERLFTPYIVERLSV